MIIHLTGPDAYRSRARLHQLRDAFIAKHDPQGFNVVMLDGLTATPAEIRSAVRGGGLFAKKNFVSLSGYELIGAACPPETLLEILAPLAKSIDTIVVIRDTASAAKKKPTRGKKATGSKVLRLPDAKREEFPTLTPAEAKNWLIKEAKAMAGVLSPALAEQLVAACDNDTWRMATELEKLVLYAGDRPITAVDISELVVAPASSDIFALTDAIGNRQRTQALKMIHREVAAGVHPIALIAMIARHIRTLRQIQQAVTEGLDQNQIAPALGVHPFVVSKGFAQSKKFTPAELAEWHHRLLETDYRLKSTPLDAEVMLDLLVVRN